ncbi:MAG: hypothetical protein ASARMPREDX12_008891 [Alectoria sarmentosa]|nr:MAG: hypothetical protein ASARMPRED_003228 [Alectoria sarmentosa]CAD6594387.1 MAG: hypothetical protein ASARMPREDX12_008891 [Alectoria sarmentosa]
MHISALLIALLTSITFTAALPTGLSFSEDLKTTIAQKRTQERDLATLKSLLGENRAYQLEMVKVASFKHKRDLDSAVLESLSAQTSQTEERPSAEGNRFDPNYKPGSIVENYENALDVSSPGYVGLGNVVETLD